MFKHRNEPLLPVTRESRGSGGIRRREAKSKWSRSFLVSALWLLISLVTVLVGYLYCLLKMEKVSLHCVPGGRCEVSVTRGLREHSQVLHRDWLLRSEVVRLLDGEVVDTTGLKRKQMRKLGYSYQVSFRDPRKQTGQAAKAESPSADEYHKARLERVQEGHANDARRPVLEDVQSAKVNDPQQQATQNVKEGSGGAKGGRSERKPKGSDAEIAELVARKKRMKQERKEAKEPPEDVRGGDGQQEDVGGGEGEGEGGSRQVNEGPPPEGAAREPNAVTEKPGQAEEQGKQAGQEPEKEGGRAEVEGQAGQEPEKQAGGEVVARRLQQHAQAPSTTEEGQAGGGDPVPVEEETMEAKGRSKDRRRLGIENVREPFQELAKLGRELGGRIGLEQDAGDAQDGGALGDKAGAGVGGAGVDVDGTDDVEYPEALVELGQVTEGRQGELVLLMSTFDLGKSKARNHRREMDTFIRSNKSDGEIHFEESKKWRVMGVWLVAMGGLSLFFSLIIGNFTDLRVRRAGKAV